MDQPFLSIEKFGLVHVYDTRGGSRIFFKAIKNCILCVFFFFIIIFPDYGIPVLVVYRPPPLGYLVLTKYKAKILLPTLYL